jgi:hypothetical protein
MNLRIETGLAKVVLVSIVSIVIAVLIFAAIITFGVNNLIFGSGYERNNIIFQFCEKYTAVDDKPVILATGSSTTLSSINGLQIQNLSGDVYNVYNLGIEDGDPVAISLYAKCLVRLKPRLVIYTVSLPVFDNNASMMFDEYFLIKDHIKINQSDERYSFLDSDIKDLLKWNGLQKLFYKRKYLMQFLLDGIRTRGESLKSLGKSQNDIGVYNLKNPRIFDGAEVRLTAQQIGQRLDTVDSPIVDGINSFAVSNDTKKEAFLYDLDQFKMGNATIVIINFPSHPLLAQRTNPQIADLFSSYLNQTCQETNCAYIDMSHIYYNETDPSFFIDYIHLGETGKKDFTEKMTRELKSRGLI